MNDTAPVTACARCGHAPKNPRAIYYSAMFGAWLCDSVTACRKRQERRAQ